MAVSGSNLAQGAADAGSFSSVASASITPSSNNLVLLTIALRNGNSINPSVSSITGNGLTWVKVNSVVYDTTSTSRRTVEVWRALGASPSSGAVTVNFTETETAYAYSIDQFSGVDTTGTNGSGAIVQSTTNKDETPPTGITVTLAAFSDVNNATFGGFGESNGFTQTAGTGFSILHAQASSTEVGSLSEWKATNDTTVDYSLGSNTSQMGGVAIEIKAAGAANAIQPNGMMTTNTNFWGT